MINSLVALEATQVSGKKQSGSCPWGSLPDCFRQLAKFQSKPNLIEGAYRNKRVFKNSVLFVLQFTIFC